MSQDFEYILPDLYFSLTGQPRQIRQRQLLVLVKRFNTLNSVIRISLTCSIIQGWSLMSQEGCAATLDVKHILSQTQTSLHILQNSSFYQSYCSYVVDFISQTLLHAKLCQQTEYDSKGAELFSARTFDFVSRWVGV